MADVTQQRVNELFVKALAFRKDHPDEQITPEALGATPDEYQALLQALDNTSKDATEFGYG